MSSKPSKKRSRKNQHRRDQQKKKRENAKAKALELSKHRVFTGKIVNDMCILNLLIRKPGDTKNPVRIQAIIDTGATINAIRYSLAIQLGLPVTRQTETYIASGTKQCNVVAAELFLHRDNTTIGMVDEIVVYQAMPVPMIFGMKAMNGGILKVDTIAGEWELRYKGFDEST